MSLLSTLGKVASIAPNVALAPLSVGLNAVGIDTTPGYSAKNVLTTQAGKIFGSDGSPQQGKTAKANNNTSTPAPNQPTNSPGVYTGSAAPAYDPAQLAAYDQGISVANSALGRLPNQLDIALANIADQFGVKTNELNSNKAQAQGQYDTSSTQNRQSYVGNKNTIADRASQGLQSLLRLLGAHGAGGSSDYLYAAPNAVAQDAAQQRAGAGQTYGQNQQQLDVNWNNFLTQDKNQRDQLTDWRSQQENQARAQSDNSKQTLLQQLADLASKRAAYVGGNGVAAAQPYLDQINGLASEVDNLGRFHPTYTGNTPVYTAPSLSSYTVNSAQGPEVAQNAASDASLPFLSLLLGRRDQNQPAAF